MIPEKATSGITIHMKPARHTLAKSDRKSVDELLLGQSIVMQEMRYRIRRVASRDNPVLIEGPTGSGKELVARSLHNESKRGGRFIPVNVGAIPENLFEAELFGHVRGAFTDAAGNRMGLMRSAVGGTIFLDEIGELSLALQVKLLRVLENHEVWPVGADAGHTVDLRVVTATNANLRKLVERGRFREDLWHRLCGVSIRVPALKDHVEDIPTLANYFLTHIAQEHAEVPLVLTDGALQVLREYTWPGNVRELRALMGLLMIDVQTSHVTEAHVRCALKSFMADQEVAMEQNTVREELYALWRKHNGNADHVALELGVSRSAVYRRIQRYGLTGHVGIRSRTRRQ